jgi:hypothetical protein
MSWIEHEAPGEFWGLVQVAGATSSAEARDRTHPSPRGCEAPEWFGSPTLESPLKATIQILSEAEADYRRSTNLNSRRVAIIKGLWELMDAIPSREAKFLLKAALEPFIAAQCGTRHVLTSLPGDEIPKNPQHDPYRNRARELGAAIVQYFGFARGRRRGRIIAKQVSDAMGRGGLLIERNRNRSRRADRSAPPSIETILADRK